MPNNLENNFLRLLKCLNNLCSDSNRTLIYNILLVSAGIVLLSYGLYAALMIREMLGQGQFKKIWDKLTVFILLHIAGYTWFLVYILEDIEIIEPELVTSVIFFVGAVFVALVAYLNKEVFSVE